MPPQTEHLHMNINKAQQYAISRLIFDIEQAVRSDDIDKRYEAYDALRELGIDHMFHQMPYHAQDKGAIVYYKAREAYIGA
jgi:citrate lyase beta subunit